MTKKLEKGVIKLDANMVFCYTVIGAVFLFMWFFSYANEQIGDDVLCYYDGALTLYLDEYEFELGSRISNLPQILKILRFVYTHWSGRMPGYFVNYAGKLLPKGIQALLTAVVFVTNVLLAMRVVFKKWSETLSKPLYFTMLFLAMYWYRWGVFYTYMWTMVSIYSFAVLFCLLYYNLAIIDYQNGNQHSICCLLMIGFIAGFFHEILSLCTIIIVGCRWIIDVINKREEWKAVFRHFGLGGGYLLCFFAPGNFYRQAQSHDLVNAAYIERLKDSLDMHKYVLKSNVTGRLIYLIVVVLAYTALVLMVERHKGYAITGVVLDVIPFVLGGVTSVFAWGYAPRVPSYGLDLWVLIIYINLLRLIKELYNERKSRNRIALGICTLTTMLLFIKSNIREIRDYSCVSFERRDLTERAIKEGLDKVEVPSYDSDLSTDRYPLFYLNDQTQYNTNYYISYYGTRLVIK